MAIARLSGAGLTTIALAVALLWGCLITERMIVRRANAEMSRTLRDVRLMRFRRVITHPVSVPARRVPRPVRPALG
jgi:hypothetical protein